MSLAASTSSTYRNKIMQNKNGAVLLRSQGKYPRYYGPICRRADRMCLITFLFVSL